ncbi:hypothetical protein HG530_002700 [Fusarium avenaceum]|nr:hypothetical protein HG530_002700 [Fusarium avenaceum]
MQCPKNSYEKFISTTAWLNLEHASLLGQGLVQVEGVEEQVGLVAHALLETLALGLLVVVGEDGLVLGVSALVDDNAGTLAGGQAADVGETLLGDDNVEIVLGLVDMGAHGDDARDTVGTVEHAGSADAGRVGVGVDVDLNRGVHANDTETLDDLGGVGNSLASQKDLVGVGVPVVIEALEAVGREADGGGSGVVELSRVEEVKESVLNNLGPNLEVLELGIIKTTNNGVGDVSDSGLQRQEVGGHAAVSDLMLEELNQVTSDLARGVVHIGIGAGLVPVIGLDNGDDLGGVNLHRRGANAILNSGNVRNCQFLFPSSWKGLAVTYLVGHLDQLGSGTNGGTRDEAAILENVGSLNDGNIEVAVGTVLGVEALC